jgi:polyhydroxyalkanoate synthase subunit PhaC
MTDLLHGPRIPVPGVLGSVRREVERNLLRTRNGIKHVAGIDRARVGLTPKETVWAADRCRMWRYANPAVRHRPPVVLVASLVSRSYVLDLRPQNSFVERLRDAGFDVFLIDFGVPDAVDSFNTLETYVDSYLPPAIERAREEAGTEDVTVYGYCLGGLLALLTVAAHPELPVRNLVCMATPVDAEGMGGLVEALRSGRVEVDSLIDESGNIPASVIHNAFRIRKPTADLVQYANLWENLWNDDFVEGYQAMAQWARDHVPFPGATARQLVDQFLRRNAVKNNSLRLDGRHIDLGGIRCDVCSVVAERDDIVPPPASAPLPDLVRRAPCDVISIPAGHVGLVMGRQAATTTMPAIVGWLREHGETAEARPR